MNPMGIVGSGGTDLLEQVLAMAHDRHRILADDIANIDTPGYRMRDLDESAFHREIAAAVVRARRENPNAGRVRFDPARTEERLRSLVFHDANDRNVESLMTTMTKNSIRHAQAAALLRQQLSVLRAVVSENA